MRDLQVSTADYYRNTSGFLELPDQFTTPARAAVAFVVKVHEVLLKDFGQQSKYRVVFDDRLASGDRGAETIEGFRYLRNVGQHLIHPVVPSTNAVVGGMNVGYRSYGLWEQVPRSIHIRLRSGTQSLKGFYDRHLLGEEVVATLLNAARFFAEVCPMIPHRSDSGEWTGFPLRHQAGVPSRLHPLEPAESAKSQRWMKALPPGGDFRLVCGRCTVQGVSYVVGLTFRGSVSYTPFVERDEQVVRDIQTGYRYHRGVPGTDMASGTVPYDLGGATVNYFASPDPIDKWIGPPVVRPPSGGDYSTFGDLRSFWRPVVLHSIADLLTAREQRMAAWFPIT